MATRSLDENLLEIASTSNTTDRCSELLEYQRPLKTDQAGNPTEPVRGKNGKKNRFCRICDKSYDIVSNFRNYLKSDHGVIVEPKPLKTQEIAKVIVRGG
jgi:hypothetical protein